MAKKVIAIVLLLGAVCVGLPLLCISGVMCNYAAKTVAVAEEIVDPSAMLHKYEWFKDAAAQLDKKRADITIYAKKITTLEDAYRGAPRAAWLRSDAEQWGLWQSELAGVRASYNSLAADYNAAMAKFNWSFCEAGQLPRGATTPLPRAFKPYEEN